MKLTKAEIKVLYEVKEFGAEVEAVAKVIHKLSDMLIERYKDEFASMPPKTYQNIDNNPIFVLQSKVEAVRELKTAVESAIMNGEEAANTLRQE